MAVSELNNIILTSQTLQNFLEEAGNAKELYVKGLAGSLKSFVISVLFEHVHKPIIYIAGESQQEETIKDDLEVLVGSEKIAYLPKLSEFAHSDIVFDSIRKGQLLSALEQFTENQKIVAIISPKNLIYKFPTIDYIKKQRLVIKLEDDYNFELLKEKLILLGFNREAVVENCGEMSVRGGIIDIFPFSSDYPYRIEFFGDTVESIRIFDPATQKSIEHISQLQIYHQYPEESNDALIESRVTILDYLDKEAILFLDEPLLIKKEIEDFFQFGRNESNFQNGYISWDALEKRIHDFAVISHESLSESKRERFFNFSAVNQESFNGNLKLLKSKIEFYCHNQGTNDNQSPKIFFLCDSPEQSERMEDILMQEGVACDRLFFRNIGINQGFVFDEVGLVVMTDNQFYGRPLRWRKRRKVHKGLTFRQLSALNVGDFVVHVDHGVGKYRGLKKITIQGHERECLAIAYQDDDLLYVPLEKMDRVQKYAAKEGVIPILSKLGSKEWDRLKQKTKKHIKEIARELIQLYAKRKSQRGFAFAKDTLWQQELEASFEFEDTPDQQKASEDVKQDMESSFPMDRLICGDVGFGKTEVALRAAFKAVNNNKQVAVLVPTTILALQHYSTFRERLKNYPVKVEMLSRFRSASEQKQIIEWLKQGRVDIVVGTHRLLSKDVQFRDLGLLVIDEEHRFGVQNKESLKQKYSSVDVLSMSATPIPRTLNMGLMGIRDLSLIATPPRDRLPIYTEVAPFDKDLIRMAMLKEVQRGGQVFFVHNRVQSIDSVANMLRKLIPEVSFIVAHGQMDERQLEKVMWNFATQKYQCLVSTMIIGSGLDIPNVNTLIVNRADRFGLSQLYQLRGRVGRADQLAYAYLLVPPLTSLNRNAIKRLKIIEEFTELGSGFTIAMRDLEIRGAGNVFGAEQSGHIIALGYELYMKIIKEAIEELKLKNEGISVSQKPVQEATKVEINQDAYIPDEFIDQPELKVDIYRRLAHESEINEVVQIRAEVHDRFGALPQPVINLFNLVELKLIGNKLNFRLIRINDHTLSSYFSKDFTESADRELIQNKVCLIMDKARDSFFFFQEGKENFGLRANVPRSESDPIEYSKNFLKSLI